MKKIISIVLIVVMILPGSLFHSAVIALILVLMWRAKIKEWIVPKWKYGYKVTVGLLCVLTLLLMPSYQRIGYLMFNLLYRKFGKITEAICRMLGYNRIGYICEKLSFRL